MDAIKNALNVKANEYRQQELLGSIVAAGIIGFGSKYVSQLPTKTIAAAALNGFGLAVSAKSVGTIYSNLGKNSPVDHKDAIEAKSSAKLALLGSLVLMTATTLLRATNALDTKFSAAPQANMHLKPLLAASAGTVVLSEVGIKTVKYANNKNNERIARKAEDSHNALVKNLAKVTEEKVGKMDGAGIAKITAHLQQVIAFDNTEASLDTLIGWVNTQAGVLNISDWKDITRA
jgi:hypothetical protein